MITWACGSPSLSSALSQVCAHVRSQRDGHLVSGLPDHSLDDPDSQVLQPKPCSSPSYSSTWSSALTPGAWLPVCVPTSLACLWPTEFVLCPPDWNMMCTRPHYSCGTHTPPTSFDSSVWEGLFLLAQQNGLAVVWVTQQLLHHSYLLQWIMSLPLGNDPIASLFFLYVFSLISQNFLYISIATFLS